MTMKDNNLELQSDEMQVLQSIYGEEMMYLESELCHQLELTVHEESNLSLVFQFWYPESYPSHDPPHYTIRCPWITKQQKSQFDQVLIDMFEPGNVIVYQWIEWIKNGAFYDLSLDASMSSNDANNDTDEYENGEGVAVRRDASEHSSSLLLSEQDQAEMLEAIERLNIKHGETFTEKKSVFVAHVASVHSLDDVHLFLSELKKDRKVAAATHNIVAYRFTKRSKVTGEDLIEENRDDDGETGASTPMLFLLQRAKAVNVCVVVTRWFGGVLLGPDRFRVITNVAKELLQREGWLKSKQL